MRTALFEKTLAILYLAALLAGCVGVPPVGDIMSEGMPEGLLTLRSPRNCALTVDLVEDLRPAMEVTATDQSKPRFFYTLLLIWTHWSTAGPVFQKPEYYDPTLMTSLGLLMEDVASKSNLCSGKGTPYTLKTKLLHYYGVSYNKSMFLISIGGGAVEIFGFFPTGHVSMELSLTEASGKTVAQSRISESFLFNPEHPLLSTEHNVHQGLVYNEANLNNVASIALTDL